MTELQVGQPALVINVEFEENRDLVGKCVTVLELMSTEQSKEYFYDAPKDYVTEPYALIQIEGDDYESGIRQRYLMPIPPLDDDILEKTNIKQPEGETA